MTDAVARPVAYDPVRTPYRIDEREFPRTGTLEQQFAFLLRYAILAPSTHNSQPWRFVLSENGIEVYADYGRRLPVADPGNRELLMSLGAAIYTLRVAAAHFAFRCVVDHEVSLASDRPVATVYLTPGEQRSGEEESAGELLPHVPVRRTNRHPFLVSRVPASVVQTLERVAEHHAARMMISTDGSLNNRVAALVEDAERRRYADPAFRRDLAEWIHPDHADNEDGMTGATWGAGGIPSVIVPWATRMLDMGRMHAAHDRNLCIEAPALVVIASEDGVPCWLDVGELLQHFLLTVTKEGLQASYFNMILQVPDLRVELKRQLGLDSWPQLLLRIGYCLAATEPTPRRPLEDVIVWRGA